MPDYADFLERVLLLLLSLQEDEEEDGHRTFSQRSATVSPEPSENDGDPNYLCLFPESNGSISLKREESGTREVCAANNSLCKEGEEFGAVKMDVVMTSSYEGEEEDEGLLKYHKIGHSTSSSSEHELAMPDLFLSGGPESSEHLEHKDDMNPFGYVDPLGTVDPSIHADPLECMTPSGKVDLTSSSLGIDELHDDDADSLSSPTGGADQPHHSLRCADAEKGIELQTEDRTDKDEVEEGEEVVVESSSPIDSVLYT